MIWFRVASFGFLVEKNLCTPELETRNTKPETSLPEHDDDGEVVGGADVGVGVDVGDPVTVFATRSVGQGSAFGSRPKVRSFYVAGGYETGLADFDERFVYADIEQARTLLGYAPGQASRLDVTLDDIERSPQAAEAIIRELGPPVFARSGDEVEVHLGTLDAPDQLVPTYETWVIRREGWLPDVPLARQYDRNREGEGRSED